MPIPQNVVPALARAISKRGYETLTPVQEAVLAPHLQAADLIVSAQTGSGKTVAFGLTLAAALLQGRDKFEAAGAPLALIIAPTRELAMQVRRELEWLFAEAGGRIASCVGGMDTRDERRALSQGAHIVVGTPGRLVDHIRRGALEMHGLRAVVLDEADEMLNLGFREELEFILDAAPEERRTLMFSATMPRAIEMLAQKYQRNAQRINTASAQKQHIDIEYRALVTASHESENAIFNVLRYYDAINAIVFCGTRAAVTRLESRFANRGFSVVALSGELSQSARTHALQAMRDHRAQVCIATDVAARGIDLPDLELVIHADLPKNTEALLHRSGRTGRAGRKGTSVLIVPHSARRRTERLLREAQITAKWGDPPSVDEIKKRDDERLLGDELLSEPMQGAETGIVRALVARHGPEQIAAAFVRLYRKGQAAPEDLAPAPAWSEGQERGDRRSPRGEVGGNFVSGGAWISLSVGRNQRAEPRWLIPMLCKAGGINKRELGTIRIQQNETHVEISATSIDGFFERIGRAGNIEKGISATRIDAPPQIETPYTERPKRAERAERTERPQRAERTERVEHPPRSDRPKHAEQPRRNPKPHRKGVEERRPPSKKPAPKGKHRK
ncbi:MAG: DEAD/DEAH box helicase [Hyphomonadaceae bacterium JAD_PAG50586_4]|nr:MAG: DEAD/DEAH box helicase [Hyphomonadaceae bacterium JAD_PAG50586_4]